MLVFCELLSYLPRKLRIQVLLITILASVSAIFEVVGLLSVAPFIQYISGGAQPQIIMFISGYVDISRVDEAVFLACMSLVMIVLSFLFSLSSIFCMYRTAFSIGRYLSVEVVKDILYSNPIDVMGRNSSVFIRNAYQESNVRVVHNIFVSGVVMISRAFLASLIIISLIVFNPALSLVAISIFSLSYLFVFKMTREKISLIGREISSSNLNVIDLIREISVNPREIYLWGRREILKRRYQKQIDLHNDAQFSFNWISQTPKIIIESLTFAVVVAVCLYVYLEGRVTGSFIAQVTVFIIAGYRLLPSLQQVFYSITSISANKKALSNISPHLRSYKKNLEEVKIGAQEFSTLSLRGVSAEYGGEPVLSTISLEINKGEKIAFIGPSGSGKTTCLNVLLGIKGVSSGGVFIDGDLIQDRVGLSNWSMGCSLVSQDVCLIEGTLEDNIGFFSEESELDGAQVQASMDCASIDFMKSSDVIASAGGNLSGGQKQRIGLARALFKGGHLLALDEATSALDNEVERKIMEQLSRTELTVVMVMHRLHTLKYFDRVFVFDEGVIECEGDYQYIKDNSKVFKRLEVK